MSGGASIGANYGVAAPTNGLIVEGNVGIGTTDPKHKLDVRGNLWIGTSGVVEGATFTASADTIYLGHPRKFLSSMTGVNVDGSNDWINLLAHPGAKGIILGTSGTADATPHNAVNARVVIQASGNVGIGTTTPSTGLHIVNNTIPVSTAAMPALIEATTYAFPLVRALNQAGITFFRKELWYCLGDRFK